MRRIYLFKEKKISLPKLETFFFPCQKLVQKLFPPPLQSLPFPHTLPPGRRINLFTSRTCSSSIRNEVEWKQVRLSSIEEGSSISYLLLESRRREYINPNCFNIGKIKSSIGLINLSCFLSYNWLVSDKIVSSIKLSLFFSRFSFVRFFSA